MFRFLLLLFINLSFISNSSSCKHSPVVVIAGSEKQNVFFNNKMRLYLKKCAYILFAVVIIKVTWNYLSKTEEVHTKTCNHSMKFQDDLHEFTESVHIILKKLNLTHFLCYGSLWGQVRLSRLLPWEDKTVMCLLNEELSKIDEVMILRMFKKENFRLSYQSSDGQYTVTKMNENTPMKVILVVFELNNVVKMYKRVGWFNRLMPPFCDSIHFLDCFPPRLAYKPLPIKQFGNSMIAVPREEIEILKYHYRDNWWKEIPLKNCF